MPSGWRALIELPLGYILDRLDTIEGVDTEFFLHHRPIVLFLLLITLIDDVPCCSKVSIDGIGIFLQMTTNGYHIGSIVAKFDFLIVDVIKEGTLIGTLRDVL